MDNDVGFFDFGPGPGNSYAFHGVVGFAQAGGINDMQGHALYVDLPYDLIACGAGYGGDDGDVVAGQGIEQAGLAHIGLTGQHDVQAFAQYHALPGLLRKVFQVFTYGLQGRSCLVFFKEVDFFFGKVQCGFNQHAQANDAITQGVDVVGEHAAKRSHGAARRGFRRGVYQISHGFRLGQVQAFVQKGPVGEFTRLGMTYAQVFAGLKTACQQTAQDSGAAVPLQLKHIFARVGVRPLEVQHDAGIDGIALLVVEGQIVCVSGLDRRVEQAADQCVQIACGNAHDTDAAASGRGGDGNNGITGMQCHKKV